MPTDLSLANPIIARPARTHHADVALAFVVVLCVALLLLALAPKARVAGTPDPDVADETVTLIGP